MIKRLCSCKNLFALKMMSLFGGLIFYAPVALLIRTRTGITFSQFFILQAILSISIFIFEVPCGYISDHLGYKNTLVLSSLCIFIARVLMFFSDSFLLFSVEAALEGLSCAFSSGTLSAYLYHLSKEDFAQNISAIGSYSDAGFILSTLGFSLILFFGGIDALLLATIVCSFISFLFTCTLEKQDNLQQIPRCKSTDKSHRHRQFALSDFTIIALMGIISIAFILINFFYVTIVLQLGINESYMTVFILIYSGIQLITPCIIKQLRTKDVFFSLKLFLFIAAVIAFAIASLQNFLVLVPMLLFPTVLTVLQVYLEQYQNARIDRLNLGENRATVLSLYSMVSRLIEILFLLGSSVISNLSIYPVFLTLSVFLLFSLSIVIFQNKHNHLSNKSNSSK